MSDVEWVQLAYLLRQVSNIPELTWRQKREALEQAMEECGAADELAEVVSWLAEQD